MNMGEWCVDEWCVGEWCVGKWFYVLVDVGVVMFKLRMRGK